MASESSSAVLELTDADAEDTDAPSVAEVDDTKEGAPLIMEHGHDIAVKVDAPLKQLSTLETFVTYRVRCACARWPTPPHVRRRYNHFKVLHKRLAAAHPLIAIPPLPPLHSARQQLDRYSPSFVAIRTIALNAFLERVAKHPILTHSEDFRLFVTTPDEELDKVFKSESNALNLWGLSSALYGNNAESKPTNGARVKDPEFSAAADYLTSLQHKLTTLCSLTTKLYKGCTALGTDLTSMKRVCDAWSSQPCGPTPGLSSRAVSGAGCGFHCAGRAYRTHRAPLTARATLPLTAAYARAHVDKIHNRDLMHAAYVASNAETGAELHNQLEQASEALRAELAHWVPHTRAQIRATLLDTADRQVHTLSQVLMGWEHALKLSTEANVEDLFKTVSKTAVQNLSPSKCKDTTPTETERDFDDLDNYSDSDIQDLRETEIMQDEENVKIINDNVNLDESVKVSDESVKNGMSEMSKLDSRTEALSDPLQSFSEVDLTS